MTLPDDPPYIDLGEFLGQSGLWVPIFCLNHGSSATTIKAGASDWLWFQHQCASAFSGENLWNMTVLYL